MVAVGPCGGSGGGGLFVGAWFFAAAWGDAVEQGVKAGALRDRFYELKQRLGVRGDVELLMAEGDTSPMALGVFRRRVLMPEALLKSLNDRQIDSILAHELAHHRRYDTWLILLENVLLAVWWFHPVFWLVLKGLGARGRTAATTRCWRRAFRTTSRIARAFFVRRRRFVARD